MWCTSAYPGLVQQRMRNELWLKNWSEHAVGHSRLSFLHVNAIMKPDIHYPSLYFLSNVTSGVLIEFLKMATT